MKAFMKSALFAGAAFIALAAAPPADAARKLGKYETYCLQTSLGGGRGGGGTYLDCRFATMGQCYASKVGQADTCILNPVLAFEQRGNFYR